MKMSRILTIIAVVLVLMLTFTSCEYVQGLIPGLTPEHQHSFVEGKCECGETDPDYVAPQPEHTHSFVEGKCECGESDPDYKEPTTDHTHSFVEGKCECGETDPNYVAPHEHNFVEGKCECGETDPDYVAPTTPVITVNPSALAINAGDDIDLMFGVTVSDEGDDEPALIIEDDSGFDASVEGTYVITYLAVNKFGNEARATRTVVVNKALSALSLEVQKNILGEEKWTGNILNFLNKEYVVLTGNADLLAQSGVFYNSTNSEITLSVGGGYGVAAIITANGVVIEGRDGANAKLIDAKHPERASSTAFLSSDAFAKDMKIPAGGYAIVVQSGYTGGTTVDSDGRGFMNWNVIGTYGNVVRLVWADTQEVLTPYVDQAPVISGYGNTVYAGSSEFVLDTEVLAGVTATDDNGTFDPNDDVTVTVTIKDNGGFDIEKQGKYYVVLEATDGVNVATVTRTVEVTTSSVEIKINNNSYTTLDDLVAVDKDLTVLGKYLFIIYTPDYKGGLNWTNGYGVAVVINKYGEIVRIYDGASAKYFDAEYPSGVQNGTCTAAGYLKEAFESRQAGEYILVAPNGNGNVSRSFLYSNRTVGAKVTLPGITFAAHECQSICVECGGCCDEACAEAACLTKCSCHNCESVCDTCGKCTDADCTEEACSDKCEGHEVPAHECESVCEHCAKCTDAACTEEVCASKCAGHEKSMFVTIGTSKKYEAVDGKWAINQEITTNNAATKAVWVFDKTYTGSFSTNGWGVAVVLDSYGRIVRVYDGANAGYTDAASGVNDKTHGVTTNNFATLAWEGLQAGETLVVFPNGGSDGNAARQIGLDSRFLINQKMNITGVEFDAPEKTIKVNGKEFVAAEGKWLYNTTVSTAQAQNYSMIIFDKNFEGSFTTNAYGAAIVLNQYGMLVRVYDGANLGLYQGNGKETANFTTSNYATVAFSELKDGEILIIFPNDGTNAADSARTFALGLRTDGSIGKVASLTGFKFESPEKTITIGAKTYTAEYGKWLYNTAVTTGTAANYAIIIYDKNFDGSFTTNGYGVAVVLTAEGKVSRVYDGANGGYTDAEAGINNKTYGVTVNNFATLAWESLQEGELLIILPNGGTEGNAARQVGLDCRYLIGQKMSVTGFAFK